VLSADYFSVPEEEIKRIESVLTVVGGKVVYGAGEFARLAPPALPVSPDWSPVGIYGGYHQPQPAFAQQCAQPGLFHQLLHALAEKARGLAARRGPVGLPCECFAF
jgi:hypothetical protein